MELAKRIEQMFKDYCAKAKEQFKLNFGVYYTPAENLCYTAMTKFKEKYGIIPNVSDKEFFTNSIHVPVWKKMSPFDKIDIESQLTGYSSAGCITYVELDAVYAGNAIENFIDLTFYSTLHSNKCHRTAYVQCTRRARAARVGGRNRSIFPVGGRRAAPFRCARGPCRYRRDPAGSRAGCSACPPRPRRADGTRRRE